ncbi:MAG TPA: type II toxin-antitoxin system HicB family antitoxin [Candidatus Desulfofervidus auxilii]|uniref:Type II toxin-antitoxin system HicB family antitoxin n=1 Tax=Desulfofervidus auxilii TaxID=1621989 RepID=A0A7C1ZS06_DESA2|nr:type II toxin-antitoxin system HicB family antitoxin [Candidatus Desulfofervidus auxilii]
MSVKSVKKAKLLPLLIEKDEDGFYVVECPLFSGCYTQGKTLDEALKNIQEVIELCLEEEENRQVLEDYNPQELSFYTLAYA